MSGPWVGGGWTSLDCEDEDGWTSGHPGSWFGIRLSKALLCFSGGQPTESHFVKLLRSPGPPTVPTFSSQGSQTSLSLLCSELHSDFHLTQSISQGSDGAWNVFLTSWLCLL